jgi:hypothetical protein
VERAQDHEGRYDMSQCPRLIGRLTSLQPPRVDGVGAKLRRALRRLAQCTPSG